MRVGFPSDMNGKPGKMFFLGVRERELHGCEKHLCSFLDSSIAELELGSGIAEREGQPERQESTPRNFSDWKQIVDMSEETYSSAAAHAPEPVPETGIDISSGPSLALGTRLDGRDFSYDIDTRTHGAETPHLLSSSSHRTWYVYGMYVLLC